MGWTFLKTGFPLNVYRFEAQFLTFYTLIITVLNSRLSFLVSNRGLKYVCIVEFSVTDSFGWKSDASFCKQTLWALFLVRFPWAVWHMLSYFLESRNAGTILTCTTPFHTNLSLASTAFPPPNLEGVNCMFSLFSIWGTALVEETSSSRVHTGRG